MRELRTALEDSCTAARVNNVGWSAAREKGESAPRLLEWPGLGVLRLAARSAGFDLAEVAGHMRFALIFAFVGSVLLFHVDTAEARSGARAVEAQKQKAKKRHSSGTHGKAQSKTTHRGSKRSHKAPVEADEEVAVADDTDTPAPAPAVAAPAPSRNAVAQATDDEEPAPAPKKKRW